MIFCFKKKNEYYDGLLVKADLHLHAQIARKISNMVPRGGVILDFGAGEGALSARLADAGYKIIAVDKNGEDFKTKKAEFHCLDFDSKINLDNFVKENEEKFDAVLGIEVIEHVQDQWTYVRQLVRMAKPGGVVLITTPNITSWLSRVIFLLKGRFHQFGDSDLGYGHINPISPWELQLILSSNDVDEIEVCPAGTLPMFYINGSLRTFTMNIFAILAKPFMHGLIYGWCIMACARKIK